MKAALASSLAYRPRLLVLDEPFTGLDPLVRDELVEGLVDSAQETTMLISSHDLAEIESFATHVGYLDQGQLNFSETLSVLSDRFREIEVLHRVQEDAQLDGPGRSRCGRRDLRRRRRDNGHGGRDGRRGLRERKRQRKQRCSAGATRRHRR